MKAEYHTVNIVRHEWRIRGPEINAADVSAAVAVASNEYTRQTGKEVCDNTIGILPYDEDIVVWYEVSDD